MSISGIEKLDNMVNEIKTNTIETLILIYDYIYSEKDEYKKQTPFYNIQQLILKGCIATLMDVGKAGLFEHYSDKEHN